MKSMISLEMKCPQLSKPEATAAETTETIQSNLNNMLHNKLVMFVNMK